MNWRSQHVREPLTRLSVSITRDLRQALEEARDGSEWKSSIFRKHSLSSEVEEILRVGLKRRASANFLTLQLDDGLWAWLKAHVQGIGLAGGMEDTAIYMIRGAVIEAWKSQAFRQRMFPHLPPDIQDACRTPSAATTRDGE